MSLDLCFSPLRYWGGLYREDNSGVISNDVLVPFDIGVVYIKKGKYNYWYLGFSPLRYWGGLYPYGKDGKKKL